MTVNVNYHILNYGKFCIQINTGKYVIVIDFHPEISSSWLLI